MDTPGQAHCRLPLVCVAGAKLSSPPNFVNPTGHMPVLVSLRSEVRRAKSTKHKHFWQYPNHAITKQNHNGGECENDQVHSDTPSWQDGCPAAWQNPGPGRCRRGRKGVV